MKLEKYLSESIKIKEGIELYNTDFWYDLSHGGYIDPMEICEDKNVARKIKEAVKLIMAFEEACNEQIKGFEE